MVDKNVLGLGMKRRRSKAPQSKHFLSERIEALVALYDERNISEDSPEDKIQQALTERIYDTLFFKKNCFHDKPATVQQAVNEEKNLVREMEARKRQCLGTG